MFIKNYSDYLDYINEGLIKTYPVDKAKKYLLDTLEKLGFDISSKIEDKIFYLKFKNFNKIEKVKINDLFDLISSIMTNMFGWFPSSMRIDLNNGLERYKKYNEDEIKLKHSIISNLEIEFDSKFDEYEIYNGNLYHLSIQEYKDKILKYGLFPKSKSKLSSHIDRIYVCKTPNDCYNLIPSMKLHYSDEKSINHFELNNKKWNKNTNWIVFKIKNNKDIKLYKDPRYEFGYYIMDNIDKDSIFIENEE
jgi:frataxin-like iron-binding protein CyaY